MAASLVGVRVRIVQNIDGDDTPIGSRGKIVDVESDGYTVVIELDDYPGELYYSSVDGDDWDYD